MGVVLEPEPGWGRKRIPSQRLNIGIAQREDPRPARSRERFGQSTLAVDREEPDAELRDWVPPQSARHWRDLLGSEDPGDWAELQYRLSVPLGLLAFAVLAVPLARSPPRSGVYGRLTFAVLLYFTFLNLQKIAERLLAEQAVPAWLGMWWLPALMVVVTGLVVMFDSNRFRVRLRRWLTRRKTA